MRWSALKPAVSRPVLRLLAGLMWTGVGAMLLVPAAGWVAAAPRLAGAAALLGGLTTAVVAHRHLFSRLVEKNLARIAAGPERPCLFSFQALRSWVLVAGMVALGVALRRSGAPRTALAYVYFAVGGALVLGSRLYYRALRAPVC